MSSFVESNMLRYANDKPSFRRTTLDMAQNKIGIKDIAVKRDTQQNFAIYSRKRQSLGLEQGGLVLRPHLRQAMHTTMVTSALKDPTTKMHRTTTATTRRTTNTDVANTLPTKTPNSMKNMPRTSTTKSKTK